MKPGLSNISALLSKMANPQEKLRIIHIAGTNGKGTVAALISNALSDCGLKTGLFTSPWVVDYREQIQINGSFIPEDRFAAYWSTSPNFLLYSTNRRRVLDKQQKRNC